MLQIRVNSSKLIRVTQVENEDKLKELEQFSIWNFFSSFLKEKLNDTYVNVGLYSTKTCLKVEIIEKDTKYSVIVIRSKSHLCFSDGFCSDKDWVLKGIISETEKSAQDISSWVLIITLSIPLLQTVHGDFTPYQTL